MNKPCARLIKKKKIRIPVLDCAPFLAFSGAALSSFTPQIKIIPSAFPLAALGMDELGTSGPEDHLHRKTA
jgi:hypothetical protein